MTTFPFEVGRYGGELYDRLGPLARQDEVSGYGLLVVAGAIGVMHEPTHAILAPALDDDDAAPWAALGDVDEAPAYALPWTAQLVGERVPPGEAEDLSRERIRTPSGLLRGSLPPLIEAGKATLTGTQALYVFEQTSSEWTMTVVTAPAETPDAAATNAALQRAKAAGIILTHVVTDLTLIDALAGDVNSQAGTIDSL